MKATVVKPGFGCSGVETSLMNLVLIKEALVIASFWFAEANVRRTQELVGVFGYGFEQSTNKEWSNQSMVLLTRASLMRNHQGTKDGGREPTAGELVHSVQLHARCWLRTTT